MTPQADLSILKTDGVGSVVTGTNDTYTITVTNNGPSTVTGATVSDVLPLCTAVDAIRGRAVTGVHTCALPNTTGTLATGGTASFTLTIAISPTLTGTLANTATVAPP